MKKLALTILAFAVVSGSYWVSREYFRDRGADAEFNPPRQPIPVEVAIATREPMRETVTYSGSVRADETVTIASRVSGIIRAIHVHLGDYVMEGDPLVDIDDAEFVERLKQAQANLQLAEAQLRRSQTQLELAQRDYERVAQLARDGVSMLQQVDQAQAERDSAAAGLEVAKAEVERIKAALEEAQLNLADTRIRSPLEGWVQMRHTDPGALASASMPILTIVDTDPAKVVVYIPERELGLADLGRRATVAIGRGAQQFEGTVSRVSPSLSMSTRTTEAEIHVPNPDRRLRPGMSADVTLVAREDESALVIPEPALVFQHGRMEVYRVVDGIAEAVVVETGMSEAGLVQITRGLEAGDRVIVKGQYLIKDGQEVKEVSRAGDRAVPAVSGL